MTAARNPMWWVGAAALAVGAAITLPMIARAVMQEPVTGMFSIALWNLYALVFWLVVRRVTRDRPRPAMATWIAFAWGALVVPGIGLLAVPGMRVIADAVLPADAGDEWTAAVTGALVEEPLKLLGVVALAVVPLARFRSVLDGIYYGVFVGLGFQVVDSLVYSVDAGAESSGSLLLVLQVVLLRGVVNGLWSHPTLTGITGAGVGYFFTANAARWKRWSVLVGLAAAAIALHVLAASPLLAGDAVMASVIKGVPVLFLFALIWWLARREALAAEAPKTPQAQRVAHYEQA